MGCEMETDQSDDMDIVLSSMWPEEMNEAGRQFNVEKPGVEQDMLEEVAIKKEPNMVDFQRLMELANYSDKGNWQLDKLVKNWEYRQANAVRLLREELDNLSKQRQEVELTKLEILEEHSFKRHVDSGDKCPISILDEDLKYFYQDAPKRKNDIVFHDNKVEMDAEYDSIVYWKQRAMHLEKLLEASLQCEQILLEKLEESIENLERQSSPVEELSQVLKRADNFLHFVLQNAPVVIGHQDKDLRYRFIFNHFPSLGEQDIIGKTDVEIFSGSGVKESQDFKREVLERGKAGKREITFETELFGSKTFLIYVEPVFSKSGETIGVNYMGMEVTEEVRKREKMAKLREEIAVQKAKETELNKSIHITEESMRAKQMLATMSHEIRSPLSGVVSMAEILSTTNLDKEQRQLLGVMMSSGDLVLQLINDILDLSKVESGVMKLEATKFRPREVVKHVLQTAAASLRKLLTLEGHVADDVPLEVVGDVLRIRQILTNLVSNAIKFTHEGKVGINLYVVSEPSMIVKQGSQKITADQSSVSSYTRKNSKGDQNGSEGSAYENHKASNAPHSRAQDMATPMDEDEREHSKPDEPVVWIRCDVYDTGIGIPDHAIPTLFKKYMQVGADTARKYGGTGLGLAICKQLVELMGGHLTVLSVEHRGSTFTFVLPYKVSSTENSSDDPDELWDMDPEGILGDGYDDDPHAGDFLFQPRTLGTLFASQSVGMIQKLMPSSPYGFNDPRKSNRSLEDAALPVSTMVCKEISSEECRDLATAAVAMKTPPGVETSPSRASSSLNQIPSMEQTHSHTYTNSCQSNLIEAKTLRPSNNADETLKSSSPQVTSQVRNESSGCSTSNSTGNQIPEAKPTILLVEDNKINVMVTKSMMKQLGHNIEIVYNGSDAVRAVQRSSYDLVLMDVCMPVMDGLQATRLIRSFEETGSWDEAIKAGIEMQGQDSPHRHPGKTTKRIPIIAMTANTPLESAEECYANGMDSFVSKPMTFQNLKQCLQQYLPGNE